MQYTRNEVSLDRATYRVRGEVIDIFPADAAASNTTELALGQMWMKNLKEALPRSTPMSRLPARAPGAGGTPPPPAPHVPSVPGSGSPPSAGCGPERSPA